MTEQQITDPKDWRPGDDVRIEWPDGSVLTSRLVDAAAQTGVLWASIGHILARGSNGVPWGGDGRTITVTRPVDDIPEPTALGAVVEFKDGSRAMHGRSNWVAACTASGRPSAWGCWYMDTRGWFTWAGVIERHGPAVALLSPGVQDGAR